MRPVKRRKNKEDVREPSKMRLLKHDPLENLGLTEMAALPGTWGDPTYQEALQFLSSWYGSDQYAGMEHERGRSKESGRHMLQTPYGKSRMGNRNAPIERAMWMGTAGDVNTKGTTDTPSKMYGEYDPAPRGKESRFGSVTTYPENILAWNEIRKPSALVHELYHGAESTMGGYFRTKDPYTGEEIFENRAIDRRFVDVDQGNEGENQAIFFTSANKTFDESNPFTLEDWVDMNITNKSGYRGDYDKYVTSPAEITARLRQATFEAQKLGLLPEGDFNLTIDILKQLQDKIGSAAYELIGSIPEDKLQELLGKL